MRLYLSSFRMGEHPERLVELLDVPGAAAVIANSIDGADDATRREGVQREVDALAELGIAADELDLREHFGAAERLEAELERFRLLWVRGGNAFVLRHALAQSGADTLIPALLARDAVVYAGYSAGPCVLAPSLRGLELVDDPGEVTRLYGAEPIWEGLGVLDFAFVPHVDSPDHPETEACNRLAAHYRAEAVPHRALRDGQALVVDGQSAILV
jgi:dipeptidase E